MTAVIILSVLAILAPVLFLLMPRPAFSVSFFYWIYAILIYIAAVGVWTHTLITKGVN